MPDLPNVPQLPPAIEGGRIRTALTAICDRARITLARVNRVLRVPVLADDGVFFVVEEVALRLTYRLIFGEWRAR